MANWSIRLPDTRPSHPFRQRPTNIRAAFWYEEELCGLCYATPRRSTICMKIVLLQGHTCKTNTLRGWIAPMALLTTEFYARKLGCTQIEVQEPDSGAIPYYQTLGFYFDTTGRLVFPLDDQ